MLSIEGDRRVKKERFVDNLPYRCIKIKFGMSDIILPKLEWDNLRTVLWLDYDEPLESDEVNVLHDVSVFCRKACPGSMLIVTVDADPDRAEDDNHGFEALSPLKRLRRDMGDDKVPPSVKEENLDGWGRAKVYRQIIVNEIQSCIADKNKKRPVGSHYVYEQLFNFHYKDSAMMLTLAGIIYDEGTLEKFKSCGFDKLDFYRPGDEPLLIQEPKLTYREIRQLNQQLPQEIGQHLVSKSIPVADLKMYEKVYRWFPTFAETEL